LNHNFNLSPEQMQQLLNLAGQKLGTDPNQLKTQLEGGALDGVLDKMDPAAAAQVGRILNDPAALRETLGSPKVKLMLAALLARGEQGNG